MRVVMLEEGERFTTDDFNARPRDMTARLYRDAGQTATVGNVPIVLPLGSGVGGTTLVNSGTCFRTPATVLAMWRERFGLERLSAEALDPFFRRVERDPERRAGPARARRPQRARREARRRRARLVAATSSFATCAAAWARGCAPSAARRAPSSTSGSPTCRAPGMPAPPPTRARARSGIVRRGRARPRGGGRHDRRRPPDRRVRHGDRRLRGDPHAAVPAPQRPRARIGRARAATSRSTPPRRCAPLFDEEIDMARGVPQSYFVDEFADEGIMFEGAAGPPDYAAMSLPFAGERHRDADAALPAPCRSSALMVSDISRGSRARACSGASRSATTSAARTSPPSSAASSCCASCTAAAGARAVFPPVEGVGELRDGRPGAAPLPPDACARPDADGVPPARHRARRRAPRRTAWSTRTCGCTASRASTWPTAASCRARSA